MPSFILNEKFYAVAKWLVQIVLPACAALYFGLAPTLGLPNAEQVVGTIAVVTVFLGTVLGISTKNYNESDRPYDGTMVVTTDPDGTKTVGLELNGDPHDVADKKVVTFKAIEA